MVKEILAKEDNVKAVRAPVIVVGDGSPPLKCEAVPRRARI